VSRDRGEVDVHLLHVEGYFADALHRIGMKEHAALAGDLSDLGERVDGADFVVGEHDGDENRLVGDRLFHVVGVHASVGADR
jgi:hypothetical protein